MAANASTEKLEARIDETLAETFPAVIRLLGH